MICIKCIKSTTLVGECLILFDHLNYNISKRQCYISTHFKLLNLPQIYQTSSLHSILQIYLPLCFFLLSLLFLYLSPYALAALCLFFLHKFTPFPHILLITKAFIDMFFFFSISLFLFSEAQKLPYYAAYSPARLAIHTLCTSHYLDLVITFIICINVITMSLEHYSQPQVLLDGYCLLTFLVLVLEIAVDFFKVW